MSEFLAEAVVSVRADTKKFIAEFNKVIAEAEKRKVDVLVRPDFTGFKKELQAGVRNSQTGVTARVLVRPDMTGFRTALQAAVLKSSKGVVADVTVRAGTVAKGAAAAATGGGVTTGGIVDKRAAAAQLAVNQAVAAGVAARRRITDAMSDEERFATRLAREQLALKAATDAVNKAVISGVPELLALAEAEQRAAQGALALSAAQQTRRALNVPIGVSTVDFAAQAAAERAFAEQWVSDHKRMIKMSLLQSEAIDTNATKDAAAAKAAIVNNEKRAKSIEAELKALRARSAALDLITRNQISDQTRARDILGQPIIGGPQAIGSEAAERNKIANETARTATHVEAELASARRAGVAALQVTTNVEKQLAATRGALRTATNAELLAEENLNRAYASGIPIIIARRAAELDLARATALGLASTTKRLETEAKQANLFATVRRATIAQIANLTGLRGAALTAATGFIGASAAFIALRKSVGLAAEMESELAVFAVTAEATAHQMDEVHEKAIELGKDITLPAVSASDAAKTLTELSKAGLSVEDSMDGARGVLQLATAANIDFSQATLLAANALNSFGLEGSEAEHVADVLANAANESQGSIVDMGVALQQSSAVIRQAGLSLEQGVAALTLFAKNGLRGSDAGTSLRTALIRLINPSEKAAKVIDNLGLKIRDSSGAIDLGVFQQFTDATKDMSTAQRDQALAIVFGQDAIRGAAILAREGAAGQAAMEAEINKVGTAAEVAAARTSGYAGAVENLKNQIEAVAEEIGAALLPGLTVTVNLIGGTIRAVSDLADIFGRLRQSTAKPFEFVMKTVGFEEAPDDAFKERDGMSAREKVLDISRTLIFGGPVAQIKLFADGVRDLNERLEDTKKRLEDITGIDFFKPVTLKQAKDQIAEITAEINKANAEAKKRGFEAGSPFDFNKGVVQLQQLAEELQHGDEASQKLAEHVRAFIVELQNASAEDVVPKFDVPTELVPSDALARSKKHVDRFVVGTEEEMRKLGIESGAAIADGVKAGTVLMGEDARDAIRQILGKDFVIAGGAAAESLKRTLVPKVLEAGQASSIAFMQGFDPTELGSSAAEGFLNTFTENLEIGLAEASVKGAKGFAAGTFAAIRARRKATEFATKRGAGQLLGTQRAQTRAQIAGDVKAEVDVLQTRARILRREIDRINKANKGNVPTDPKTGEPILRDLPLQKRTEAENELNSTLQEIESLTEKQKADIKSKADDIKKAQDERDQAVLDALFPATRKLETAALRAEGTTTLQDNINVAKKQIQDNLRQIAVIGAQFNDKKKAAELIADLRDDNLKLSQQIAADTQGLFDATTEAFDVRFQAAETEGNIDKQIAITKQRIAKINESIRVGEVEGATLKKAIAERRERRATLEQLQQQQQEARTAFAQSIFDLTGNKNPLIKALDTEIKNALSVAADAKKGSVKWLQAMTKVNELRERKKELIKSLEDDAKDHTTAFDLMSEFNARFGEIAGNLVTPDQPFAGGSEFTDSIVNKAISGFKGPPHRPIDLRLRGEQTTAQKQINVTEELIGAIRENTEAQRGGGNRSTVTRDALFTPTNPGWGAAKKAREERDG